jgi:hypothetical protein
MPKEFKPGWNYGYNNALKQEIAVNVKSGNVYCEDGTVYKPEEIKIMKAAKQKINPEIHLIKKVFDGEIVGFSEKPASYVKDSEPGAESE